MQLGTQFANLRGSLIQAPMRFTNPKGDEDIRQQMREKSKRLDTEYKKQTDWPVRLPDKVKNLGRN